ncbi:MAG: YidC/Oxa1 family rane protein insertase [Clostridiales bacterium]|nr:YidC/Oxa1 family rane protein insertase [Clostridiales bacterium]
MTAALASVLEWINGMVGSYAYAIIIFTILIRTVLAPLDIMQRRSTDKMNAIQPKLKELEKKYGKDKQKLQQKTMELYQKEKINPLGGCLPAIVQMVLLIMLFAVIRELVGTPDNPGALVGQSFLWIKDISLPDAFWVTTKAGEINGYFILPALSGITQYLYMKLSMLPQASSSAQQQNPMGCSQETMSIFLPLFSVYITSTYASAFALYWVASNIFQVVEFLIIRPKNTSAVPETVKEG